MPARMSRYSSLAQTIIKCDAQVERLILKHRLMRVREYNIISHSKLPEYHKRAPNANFPLIDNDVEYLTMRRTLSQNQICKA